MNRPELFVKSVDILVDAFQKGKLQHLSACNCAVGNLIAYRKGSYNHVDNEAWLSLVEEVRSNYPAGMKRKLLPEKEAIIRRLFNGNEDNVCKSELNASIREINKTEYTVDEVEKIERAFEDVDENGKYPHQTMHPIDENGNYINPRRGATIESICRAIDALGEIHKVPEKSLICMKDHVINGTYKFSYSFKSKKAKTKGACPVIKPLK